MVPSHSTSFRHTAATAFPEFPGLFLAQAGKMGDWRAHCMLVTLTHCGVPYVSMQGPQQMQGARVGEARLSWVLVFTLSRRFLPLEPLPGREEEIKTRRGSRSKAAHHLRARAAQVPLLSLETPTQDLSLLRLQLPSYILPTWSTQGPSPNLVALWGQSESLPTIPCGGMVI